MENTLLYASILLMSTATHLHAAEDLVKALSLEDEISALEDQYAQIKVNKTCSPNKARVKEDLDALAEIDFIKDCKPTDRAPLTIPIMRASPASSMLPPLLKADGSLNNKTPINVSSRSVPPKMLLIDNGPKILLIENGPANNTSDTSLPQTISISEDSKAALDDMQRTRQFAKYAYDKNSQILGEAFGRLPDKLATFEEPSRWHWYRTGVPIVILQGQKASCRPNMNTDQSDQLSTSTNSAQIEKE